MKIYDSLFYSKNFTFFNEEKNHLWQRQDTFIEHTSVHVSVLGMTVQLF